MKQETLTFWSLAAAGLAVVLLTLDAGGHETKLRPTYGFGANVLPIETQFGAGFEVKSLECNGPAAAQGIERGDVLVYVEVHEGKRPLSAERLLDVRQRADGRVAAVTVVRNDKVADKAILMAGPITGNNKC